MSRKGFSFPLRLLAPLVVSAVLLPACVGPAPVASVKPPGLTASPASEQRLEATEPPAATVPTCAPEPATTVAEPSKPKPSLEPILYNMPSTTLVSDAGLYVSPNRAELIVQAAIPAGETVYVMGRNVTDTHLRVVWHTGIGWGPLSFTDYNGQRRRGEALPIIARELPGCAVPITTQFDLDSKWTADQSQRVVILVDLFRSEYGGFPPSSLSLTINREEAEGTKRTILSQGQFLLIDHQFGPILLKQCDRVGYLFRPVTQETLMVTATVFRVPEGCAVGPRGGFAFCMGCGHGPFSVRPVSEQPGEQLTEVVSYEEYAGLDNSAGTEPLEVQIEFERNFYYKIIERLNTDEIPAQRVKQSIVELYRLPPNNPEETLQTALCPISIMIPAGQRGVITVEWTELWAEGVINKGERGEGDPLGTYSVFLGYTEPCSLISEEYTN